MSWRREQKAKFAAGKSFVWFNLCAEQRAGFVKNADRELFHDIANAAMPAGSDDVIQDFADLFAMAPFIGRSVSSDNYYSTLITYESFVNKILGPLGILNDGTEIGYYRERIDEILLTHKTSDAEKLVYDLYAVCDELNDLIAPMLPMAAADDGVNDEPRSNVERANPMANHEATLRRFREIYSEMESRDGALIKVREEDAVPAPEGTIWVAPHASALPPMPPPDDLSQAASTLREFIDQRGLKPSQGRAVADVRLIIEFRSTPALNDILRLPVVFSGGYPDRYASYRDESAGPGDWGRTVVVSTGAIGAREAVAPAVAISGALSSIKCAGIIPPEAAEELREHPDLIHEAARNRYRGFTTKTFRLTD